MDESKVNYVGRLAMRVEGYKWVAYYALPNSMEDAVWLGEVEMALVSRVDRREQYLSFMRDVVADILEEKTGTRPGFNEPDAAPEHERSGRA